MAALTIFQNNHGLEMAAECGATVAIAVTASLSVAVQERQIQ